MFKDNRITALVLVSLVLYVAHFNLIQVHYMYCKANLIKTILFGESKLCMTLSTVINQIEKSSKLSVFSYVDGMLR